MNKFLTFSLLLLAAFAFACNSAENANNANRTAAANHNANANTNTRASGGASDGWVTLKIKLALIGDKRTSGIDGVKNVDNQLQVVPEAKRKEVNAADDKIEDAVKTAIKNDAKLKDASLTPKVNAGVVTLDGSVDTQDQLYAAAQEIRAVSGVKSVDTKQVKVKNENR